MSGGNQEKAESDKNKGQMFPEGRNNQVCWVPLIHRLGWEQKSECSLWPHGWSWSPQWGKFNPILGIENKLKSFVQWMGSK